MVLSGHAICRVPTLRTSIKPEMFHYKLSQLQFYCNKPLRLLAFRGLQTLRVSHLSKPTQFGKPSKLISQDIGT